MSIISRGARLQFVVGVALISVIPLLSLVYLRVLAAQDTRIGAEHVTVGVALVLAASGGYVILRKYPVNIVRLRGYLENMVNGEMPDQVTLLRNEDDITAVEKYLNVIIRQLRDRLEAERGEKEDLQRQLFQAQKMESLGMMASGVAHDFNNFLTGIMGNADLALQIGKVDDTAREAVGDIQQLAKRASELTRTMLTYAGRARFEMEPVDLPALVAEMIQLLRASLGSRIDLKSIMAENLPALQADPAQIRQLVMNLVMNAADAVGEKDGVITVRAAPFQQKPGRASETYVDGRLPEGDYVLIEVADTGCGMPPEVVTRIFDPFFTTKPEGRGLGLAIVLGIVRSHKGFVNVRSSQNRGTTFEIFLPAADKAVPSEVCA
ncbi:MAG: hypothetical protein JXB04_03370 [Kiritimatiellae bacterium]|nr:hypothetical protein [Kiritimatiellia bacterium]